MHEALMLDRLAQLSLKNRFALQLRQELVKLIEEQTSIPLRKGVIDLTWLAGRIGATRQIFYPHRGSPEVLQILALLNEYLVNARQASPKSSNASLEHSKLHVELILVKEENSRLKQQLRQARHDHNMMHSGGIILGDSR